jgi:hypothetical protein
LLRVFIQRGEEWFEEWFEKWFEKRLAAARREAGRNRPALFYAYFNAASAAS